jgi:hypothetical protein
MSTLPASKTALLTLLRAYPDATFDSSNSALDDWAVLTSEGRTYSLVIEMGAATTEDTGDYLAQGDYSETHRLDAWICWKRGQGEGGDAAQRQALIDLTERLKDYARPYTRLNGAANVEQARIVETSEPLYIAPRSMHAASTHVAQRITWEIQCTAAFDAVE